MSDGKSVSRTFFALLCAGIVIALIWFAAYCVGNRAYRFQKGSVGDLNSVLFGASSIALFILSVFIAILAIFGWQTLQETIHKKVAEAVKRNIEDLAERRIQPLEKDLRSGIERLENDLTAHIETLEGGLRGKIEGLENKLGGRVYSILGFVIGETNIDPETFSPKDRDLLQDAVYNSQKGYDFFQKISAAPGEPAEPGEYLALNNLVFYSSLVGDKTKGRLVLEKARLLRDKGQERDIRNFLLTYCRAILEFGIDREEIREASTIAKAILENPRSSDRERKEAKLYLTSLASLLI